MRQHKTHLSICTLLFIASSASAQTVQETDKLPPSTRRPSVSSTSNTTAANDTKRVTQMAAIAVNSSAAALSFGGGLMEVQTAPKAVSTIGREAIAKMAPSSNFTQAIESIPGVNASTNDVTGLSDGNYSIRGFDSTEIGVTINGAPINNAGSFGVYATEYGDTENIGDITVLQGIPNVDMPNLGAAGGHIAWATVNPTHKPQVDVSQSFGSHNYTRTFVRANTGDTGPVRSWLSYSNNSTDKWRGNGDLNVSKVDGKSVWKISDENSISASLQYNHEFLYQYRSPTKAQVAVNGYDFDYTKSYIIGSLDTNYWKTQTQPFESATMSLDGEFTINPNLHLTVVPYFTYGTGGGGFGLNQIIETTNSTVNTYPYANLDLNGDGKIVNGTKSLNYAFANSDTYGPGISIKLNQSLGFDNNLEYGVWWERSRMVQSQTFIMMNIQSGSPGSSWADRYLITYPDGRPIKSYAQYTVTETKKMFVTDNWTPTDKWEFNAGLAYIHTERSGSLFQYPGSVTGRFSQYGSDSIDLGYHDITPAIGVKFSPDEKNQIFYGLGKTFRPPDNKAAFNDFLIGRNTQKSETSWTNDLGWRYYSDSLAVSATLYRSNFNNKIVRGSDPTTGLDYYTNIPRLRLQGFNAEVSYNITKALKAYASYTLTESTLQSSIDGGSKGIFPTTGKTLFNTPRNLLFTSLSYDNGSIWATLSAKYRSSIYGDYMNTERVGGYTTFTVNAGYRFADWNWIKKPYIKVNLSNITNHRAFTNANNAKSFLASNPTGMADEFGTKLGVSAPTYSLLEPRTVMVTFGASFF